MAEMDKDKATGKASAQTVKDKTTTKVPAQTTMAEAEAQGRLLVWFQRNQRVLNYGLLAVGIIAVGGWLWRETVRRKEAAAAVALEQAQVLMETGNLPAAAAEFQRIAQSFRGTDAAFQAELGANAVRISSGQNQIAVDELREFVGSNPPPYYAAGAWSMLAAGLENLGQYEEAATAYRRSSELAPEDHRKVDGLLGAARASRLGGKEAEGLELLREIVSKYSKETPGVGEATVRLAEATQGRM